MPRIYAAVTGAGYYFEAINAARYPWLLTSFHGEVGKDSFTRLLYRPEHLLSDSGAFAVWNSGGEVDLDAYVRWSLQYGRLYRRPPALFINLDVMPGERGRAPTEAERKDGIRRSLENADAMREAGLPVMEVFHQLEPPAFLDQLLDRRREGEILGISPRQGIGQAARHRFLDGVFRHVLDRFGKEIPPLHGLGATGRTYIFRWPWWSADSIGWVTPGKYGNRLGRDGVFETEVDPRMKGRKAHKFNACREVLETWRKWERETSRLWEGRGITWLK